MEDKTNSNTLSYFCEYRYPNGFIQSIDNVVCIYYGCSLLDDVSVMYENFKELNPDVECWTKLNQNPNRYNRWTNIFHIGGLFVKIGFKQYDIHKKDWQSYDMMSVEINPNKHCKSPVWGFVKELCELIGDRKFVGYLKEYDLAIDVPASPADVVCFENRKEYGLYKGTRYYGSGHHKNGYTKIYDKKKESKLSEDITRIETTCVCSERLSLVDFGVSMKKTDKLPVKASSTVKALIMSIERLKGMGQDVEDIYKMLDWRTKATIKEVIANGVSHFKYDEDVLSAQLDNIASFFRVSIPKSKEDIPDNLKDYVNAKIEDDIDDVSERSEIDDIVDMFF